MAKIFQDLGCEAADLKVVLDRENPPANAVGGLRLVSPLNRYDKKSGTLQEERPHP